MPSLALNFNTELTRKILKVFLLSAFLVASSVALLANPKYGVFSGDPSVTLVGDRSIKLTKDFFFIDDKNRKWLVPKNYVADGASIPKPFWSLIGGPLTGRYRNASIIHDYFVDRRIHDWMEVHSVFYNAMLAADVGPRKAWVMYKAVYVFGPRWKKIVEIAAACKPGPDFSPDDCVVNSSPKYVTFRNPLNKSTFDSFLSDLDKEGYGAEASEIQKKIIIE